VGRKKHKGRAPGKPVAAILAERGYSACDLHHAIRHMIPSPLSREAIGKKRFRKIRKQADALVDSFHGNVTKRDLLTALLMVLNFVAYNDMPFREALKMLRRVTSSRFERQGAPPEVMYR